MKLKLSQQLLTLASLTLLLPPLAWWWMTAADHTLRESIGESRRQLAQVLAVQAKEKLNGLRDEQAHTTSGHIFISQMNAQSIAIDGHLSDWRPIKSKQTVSQGLSLNMSRSTDHLFLLVQLSDTRIEFSKPGDVGDQLVIQLAFAHGLQRLNYSFDGYGFNDQNNGNDLRGIIAVEDNPEVRGVTIELSLKTALLPQSVQVQWKSRENEQSKTLGPVAISYRMEELDNWLSDLQLSHTSLWLLDNNGNILAANDFGSTRENTAKSYNGNLWLSLLYRWLVARDVDVLDWPESFESALNLATWKTRTKNGSFWSTGSTGKNIYVTTLVKSGPEHWLMLRQDAEDVLVLANQGVIRFGLLFLLFSVSIILIFFVYAAWLGSRIRVLKKSLEQPVEEISNTIKTTQVSEHEDELGELSRSFANQQQQIREYTGYLQQLGSRLAHELRTPMTIVHGALDNLSLMHPELVNDTHVLRARDGIQRLQKILFALKESSHIESVVGQLETEPLDLNILMGKYMRSMIENYPGKKIIWHQARSKVEILADPDLIAQLMDKLMDNALSFVSQDGEISVRLQVADKQAIILIANDGPALPDNQQQLFNSLISSRTQQQKSKDPHLGLGLHIVKLIARAHNGDIKARNIAGRERVEFRVSLPVI